MCSRIAKISHGNVHRRSARGQSQVSIAHHAAIDSQKNWSANGSAGYPDSSGSMAGNALSGARYATL